LLLAAALSFGGCTSTVYPADTTSATATAVESVPESANPFLADREGESVQARDAGAESDCAKYEALDSYVVDETDPVTDEEIARASLFLRVLEATRASDGECVRYFTRNGMERTDYRNFHRVTSRLPPSPVYVAIENGDYDIAEVLLRSGLSPDDCCCSCATPLHAAIIAHHYELVELMLRIGADTSIKFDMELTALEPSHCGTNPRPQSLGWIPAGPRMIR
jgi:hypothetical protein